MADVWPGERCFAALAVGILWSDALAYRDVNLAPRDQLAELERIGDLIAGEGPTLMTEYQPYGVRHFLRDADPEGASELRRRPVALGVAARWPRGHRRHRPAPARRPGCLPDPRAAAVAAQSRPRRPTGSIWRGQLLRGLAAPGRAAVDPGVVHLGLGSVSDPAGMPRCARVRRLARRGRPSGAPGRGGTGSRSWWSR